jgi:hypothetical protein
MLAVVLKLEMIKKIIIIEGHKEIIKNIIDEILTINKDNQDINLVRIEIFHKIIVIIEEIHMNNQDINPDKIDNFLREETIINQIEDKESKDNNLEEDNKDMKENTKIDQDKILEDSNIKNIVVIYQKINHINKKDTIEDKLEMLQDNK